MSDDSKIFLFPFFIVVMLAVMFVIIPVISKISEGQQQGLIKMSETIKSFTPIYGVGLVVGLIALFFGLATFLAKDLPLKSTELRESPSEEGARFSLTEPEYCRYCGKELKEVEHMPGRCSYCGAPIKEEKN